MAHDADNAAFTREVGAPVVPALKAFAEGDFAVSVEDRRRPPVAFALTIVFLLVAIAYDLRTRRRAHPVYVWGGLLLLASGPLRLLVAQTEAWRALARVLME